MGRLMKRAGMPALAFLCALSLALAGASPAGANERDRLERERRQANAQQSALQSSLEGVRADLGQVYSALESTRQALPVARKALTAAQAEVGRTQREHEIIAARLEATAGKVGRLETDIAAGQAEIAKSRDGIAELARRMYRGEDQFSALDLVFSARTTEEVSSRIVLADAAFNQQNQLLSKISSLTQQARAQRLEQGALTERVGQLKQQAAAAVKVSEQARDEAAQKTAVVEELERKQVALSKKYEAQSQDLQEQIAQIEADNRARVARIAAIDEENRRRAEEARRRGQAGGITAGSGYFRAPIAGNLVVNSPFGYRVHPVLGYRLLHQGVDLYSPCGQVQVASASGTVSDVTYTSTGGNTVYINHGMVNGFSWITGYLHLSTISVRVGQQVDRGQQVGLTGATGRVTGCHVHFETWRNGVAINPMGVMGF